MNITFVHDLDTGFLSRTLKPYMEQLGHTVKVVQTLITQIEGEASDHIDIHTGVMKDEQDYKAVHEVFEETDFFIIRSISDVALRLLRVSQYITPANTVYKVHGSELRELGHPYSLTMWRTLPRPITVAGPRDPSLIPLYRGNVITQIERPCDFSTFPRKKTEQPPFALHTPTNIERKGTKQLMDAWSGTTIPLEVLHAVPRKDILKRKAQASYYIDRIGNYEHGPYGMNSVEAWYYKIPVYSSYNRMDCVVCPELPSLIYNINHVENIQTKIMLDGVPNKKHLQKTKEYALRTHDPLTIARQYVNLARSITEQ